MTLLPPISPENDRETHTNRECVWGFVRKRERKEGGEGGGDGERQRETETE